MGTDFSFEHVFQAPSLTVKSMLEVYFDPDHLATQDKIAELGERQIIESREDDAVKSYTWTVRSLRPLPVFVRPFVEGGRLSYLDQMTWRKAADEIDMVITPQIASGRVKITALYQLSQVGEGRVRRRYGGTINVNVSLLSGKIERAILNEMEKGMPMMAECTQKWLLERSAR